MTALAQPTQFPLAWPPGWERTTFRERARFNQDRTRTQAFRRLQEELFRLGIAGEGYLVSSNCHGLGDRDPEDPGVALYFKRDARLPAYDHVLACDKFRRVADNLWALALTLEGLRQQERFGVTSIDRQLRAYQALPAPAPPPAARPWHEVLRCFPDASEREIRAAFTARLEELHPDANGPGGDMAELTRARDEALAVRRAALLQGARS